MVEKNFSIVILIMNGVMILREKLRGPVVSVLSLIVVLGGCATTKTNYKGDLPASNKEKAVIRRVVLIPPEVQIYKYTASGKVEFVEKWTNECTAEIRKAVIQAFEERGVDIDLLDVSDEYKKELDNILPLYYRVLSSINSHSPGGSDPFPEGYSVTDYSIGAVDSIMDKKETDAIVLVYARDLESTGGRKLVQVASIATIILAGMGGYYTPHLPIPGGGHSHLSISMVDSSGKIISHQTKASTSDYDLRNPENVSRLVNEMVFAMEGLGE